ncbi:MAG: FAD-dependent oxidoreductase [Abitibacteriaceae bacterium]|nr:FAD-dependent oxidoreductase [Abditibacteriaceae bacterium]MBV9867428.1 FAD-dependent oxidoreductase [Abditibacteriaceae bacterium]
MGSNGVAQQDALACALDFKHTGENLEDQIHNVIIIGSGPAGYTAALYTARANLSPLIIAGGADPKTARIRGGQLMYTSDIENFPAAIETPVKSIEEVKGVSGPELMQRMEMQALHFGAQMVEEFVTEVNLCDQPGHLYTLKTESGKEYRTRALIIATGAAARTLGIAAEEKFFGQGGGVSTCATCDGHSYRGKVVAVVGGGDSAMEEASYLARLVEKVYLVHRRDEFRASRIMLNRAQENPKIEFILHAAISDIKGKPHPQAANIAFFKDKEVVGAAVLQDTRTGETRELPVDGIFVAIGHTPNTDLFKHQLKMDEAGYLEHDGRMRAIPSMTCANPAMQRMEHLPGVFVAGDVSDHVYRQAITAAGMGCQAAIEAERYLAEKLAEKTGVEATAVNISDESIAQSHWSAERDEMGEKPIIERVVEVVKAEHAQAEYAQNNGANTAISAENNSAQSQATAEVNGTAQHDAEVKDVASSA